MSNEIKNIEVTRINNDTNGNPRHVVHFFALLTEDDHKTPPREGDLFGIDTLYEFALQKAKKEHGVRFHNKQFGGGIAFKSYDAAEVLAKIAKCL